jgi:hypothetical protein
MMAGRALAATNEKLRKQLHFKLDVILDVIALASLLFERLPRLTAYQADQLAAGACPALELDFFLFIITGR